MGADLKLTHVIEFVGDMGRAVKFYRDVLGLPLKFESPEWSEFATGETTLALHPANAENPAGKLELGLSVGDIQKFYGETVARGVRFPSAPKKQEWGRSIARFVDSEGTLCTVSGE